MAAPSALCLSDLHAHARAVSMELERELHNEAWHGRRKVRGECGGAWGRCAKEQSKRPDPMRGSDHRLLAVCVSKGCHAHCLNFVSAKCLL
eukprot:1101775-Rhodomonas_salina.2